MGSLPKTLPSFNTILDNVREVRFDDGNGTVRYPDMCGGIHEDSEVAALIAHRSVIQTIIHWEKLRRKSSLVIHAKL